MKKLFNYLFGGRRQERSISKQLDNILAEPTKEQLNLLHVIEVDPDSDSLGEALGVTKERFDQLGKMCKVALLQNERRSATYVEISKNVKHANELVLCIMLVNQIDDQANPLHMLMDMMRRRGGDED